MRARRALTFVVTLLAVLLVCGAAAGAKGFPDRTGDVRGGKGPDIVAIRLSNTATRITFAIRFATAPPLRVSAREGWVDMLLIGIDVPPIGPRPIPDGEWRGANYALGTHGPSQTGLLVELGVAPEGQRQLARFPIVTKGSTVSFSITRRSIGNPAWFRFQVAAARETERETGGGVDMSPDRGTFRYALSG